jgi:hypothetical protein
MIKRAEEKNNTHNKEDWVENDEFYLKKWKSSVDDKGFFMRVGWKEMKEKDSLVVMHMEVELYLEKQKLPINDYELSYAGESFRE